MRPYLLPSVCQQTENGEYLETGLSSAFPQRYHFLGGAAFSFAAPPVPPASDCNSAIQGKAGIYSVNQLMAEFERLHPPTVL